MSNKVKDVDIKNEHTTFSVILFIQNFDPNNIKIDEKSCKNILIYYIGHVMVKDSKYVKINSVNYFYLIFSKMN